MSGNQTLSFSQNINAPANGVYRAFTNSTALREWLCDEASAVARPGGRLYLWWNDDYYACGEYTDLEPDKEINFTWRGKNDPVYSVVKVSLSKNGEGTSLNLEHNGVGTGKEWKISADEIEKAWQYSLENLVSVLETGRGLRFVNRPMLGITLDDFNAEIAQKIGVPVSQGIRIDGVIEGMGAGAAGLQADDVLVGLADQEVKDWSSLTSALQGVQAGDSIEVAFYRGKEKQRVTMELSRRPLPEIPDSHRALATIVEKRFQKMETELEELFANVTEEQAEYKPSSESWSAKETVAHLIHSERGRHTWMSDLVAGFEPFYDDWGGNLPARNKATVAAYPSVSELKEAFKRSCDETVAFLQRLPDEFVARKASYWRLAYNLAEEPYHFNAHLDQMRSTIEAAKREGYN